MVKEATAVPDKIRYIQFSPCLTNNHSDEPYDRSNVPLICNFIPNKMLGFRLNVDKYHKLQFLSNRDPVKSCSKIGRSIVLLQGDKKSLANKKVRVLPKLHIPDVYKQMIDKGILIIMCVVCVKEYYTEETGKIGFYIVGNKIFLENVNTKDEKQVEHVFIPLTPENTKNSEHDLQVAIIKVTSAIDNEIGPALFKLSEQYIQIARSHGFKFGLGDPLHRLAIFILKPALETNKREPDWETLCLSDYIHQIKIEDTESDLE